MIYFRISTKEAAKKNLHTHVILLLLQYISKIHVFTFLKKLQLQMICHEICNVFNPAKSANHFQEVNWKKNFKLTSIVWCDIYKIFASSFCFLTMSLHISIRPKIVANWCNKTLKNLLCYPLRQTEVKLLCELYFYFRF